jgi:hypothetical protein
MEGAIKHSAEKQPDTTQTLTLTRQRHKTGMDIPRRGSQGGRRKPPCKKISQCLVQSLLKIKPFIFDIYFLQYYDIYPQLF